MSCAVQLRPGPAPGADALSITDNQSWKALSSGADR